MFDVTTAARRNDFRIDRGAGLRESLEGLLLHDGVGLDARMRHAISAVVHLAVDAPLGVPEDAEEFLVSWTPRGCSPPGTTAIRSCPC